jgi:hypothetical protein
MRAYDVAGDLVQLAFTSVAPPHLPPAVFQRIARQASATNLRLGLTGELRLEAGRFSLVLEGRSARLMPLAGRIFADPRHRAIRVDAFGGIERRRFADWRTLGFDLHPAEAPQGTVPLRVAGAAAARHGRWSADGSAVQASAPTLVAIGLTLERT